MEVPETTYGQIQKTEHLKTNVSEVNKSGDEIEEKRHKEQNFITTKKVSPRRYLTAYAQSEIKLNDYSQSEIERVVKEYFIDIPELIEVARCESSFRHIVDGKVLRGKANSSDLGVMQINMYYHNRQAKRYGLDLYNLFDNMAYARILYEKEGLRPWNSSRPCWGSKVLAYNR